MARSLPQILVNFHWIVRGEASRAAQLHSAILGRFLKANRIRGVINLRGRHPEFGWWRRERRVCYARGVLHFDAMLDSRMLPSYAMLCGLLAAFDVAPQPVLIKCSGGQDRTSFASALYILHRQGWSSFPDAVAQFARFPFLHFPKARQRWLRLFFTYAQEEAEGRAIGQWIRSDYDPARFANWLDGNTQKLYSRIFPD
jgi:hypothetical protein